MFILDDLLLASGIARAKEESDNPRPIKEPMASPSGWIWDAIRIFSAFFKYFITLMIPALD